MWRKALACLSSILLGAAALPRVDSPSDSGQPVSAEDYAIFVAATRDLFANNKIEKVIFLDHTSLGFPPGMAAMTQFGAKAQELLREVPKDAKDAFELRNKSPLMLDSSKFDLPFQVTLLTPGDAEKAVKAGWKQFHKRYQKSAGITLLSLPGINAERDRALQYVGNSCDSLCGDGWLLLLVKEDGQWKVMRKTLNLDFLSSVTVWKFQDRATRLARKRVYGMGDAMVYRSIGCDRSSFANRDRAGSDPLSENHSVRVD